GRQEFLRLVFSNRHFLAQVPQLKRLKRQDGFYRRLDQAVQTCREIVGHEEEREFLEGRLQQLFLGNLSVRNEVLAVSRALESWMDSEQIADSARVFRLALDVLEDCHLGGSVPVALAGRRVIYRYQVQEPQSLESLFFSRLSTFIPIQDAGDLSLPAPHSSESQAASWRWRRSHTLHDSVELLMSELRNRDWSRQVILIPDTSPDVRMVLRRSLRDAGIPELDPRDPQEMRLNEQFKRLFLPLECVSSHWDPGKTISLLSVLLPLDEDRAKLLLVQRQLLSMGQRPGLDSILRIAKSSLPSQVVSTLEMIGLSFQGRLDFRTLRDRHQQICSSMLSDGKLVSWVDKFWK
ncbi:hypothetical protein EBZ37_15070, partial [bacterium]|nr:hypothetical protein [bacterium]